MRYIISGKNLDITEGLRSAVTDKLGKLERYFTPDTEVHVTLSVEKERQKIEVTIPVKGNIIRSEPVSYTHLEKTHHTLHTMDFLMQCLHILAIRMWPASNGSAVFWVKEKKQVFHLSVE